MNMNTDWKKIVDGFKTAQSQLETMLKDKTWVEEARKYADRQGKEVKKLFAGDAAKLKAFIDREKIELARFQKQIPSEVEKFRKFVKGQRKELEKLVKTLRKAHATGGKSTSGTGRKSGGTTTTRKK